jgi:hypothetical protein
MLRRIIVSAIGTALIALPSVLASRAEAQASTSGDVAIAVAGTIQQADVPSTFSATSSGSSTEGPRPKKAASSLDKQALKIAECKSFVAAVASGSPRQHTTATADGPSLEQETTQVSSAVTVFDTTSQAQQLFTPLKKSSVATCIDKLFKLAIKQNLEQANNNKVKFTKFTASVKRHPVPPVGDQTVDYQMRMDISGTAKQSGATATVKVSVYGDLQFVQTGRTLAFYTFLGIGNPIDNVQRPAVSAAIGRITQALA